jgi:Ca2+-binding EF-hand superfamily protein
MSNHKIKSSLGDELNAIPYKISSKIQRPSSARVSNFQSRGNLNNFQGFGRFPSRAAMDQDPVNKNPTKFSAPQREKLYEENLSLKMNCNLLEQENLKLKTKISQIERNLLKKDESHENPALKVSSKTHLLLNLKICIRTLKEKIKSKEDEIEKLKKNTKSTKMVEVDVEMQTYVDECTRLKHHLEEIIVQKKIPASVLEFEEKIYRQNSDIDMLRKENQDYSDALSKAREEIICIKDKILVLENPAKKNNNKRKKIQEINQLKDEIQQYTEKIEEDKKAFLTREKNLIEEAERLRKSNQRIVEKIQATEIKTQEQNIILEQLQNQVINNEKDFKRPQIINTLSENWKKKKESDPPVLFSKIHHIIVNRKMILEVFFSIMDKNNNGFIEIKDMYNFMESFDKKIKKKHMEKALTLMNVKGTRICISELQENYEKYDYESSSTSSSSEESPDLPKTPIQTLLQAPEPELPSQKIEEKKATKKFETVKEEEIKEILKQIEFKMKESKQPKSNLISYAFGNTDLSIALNPEDLSNLLKKSPLALEQSDKVLKLAQYLIQPESPYSLDNQDFQPNISIIGSRLLKALNDWEVYTDDQIKDAIKYIKDQIKHLKSKLKKECSAIDPEKKCEIQLKSFREIVEKLGENIPDEIWDKWKFVLHPTYTLNYTEFLNELIVHKSPRECLNMISEKLNKISAAPESVFAVSLQGIITAEGFIEGLNNLGIELSNEELSELLETLRYRRESSFTLIVHINDIRKLLKDSGYLSQTLSSSEDQPDSDSSMIND